jgi:CTP:molybdopterin cytidylyltransferase MocA
MDEVLFVDLDDPGVIYDIDTPDDYRRLIGELP